MERALELFGPGVIQRVLCFALYLLGLNRRVIGQSLEIPSETVKSIVKALKRDGLGALEDRRQRLSTFLPQAAPRPQPITLKREQQHIVVDLGVEGKQLHLSTEDPLQVKTVLLSMLNDGLLSNHQIADAINFTPAYTATLARRLADDGVLALADQRQGQKQDYRMPPSRKAEVVQQFTLDIIARGKTSGDAISDELQERCHITIPARTVRHHLARMGLPTIKRSLPQLLAAVKKNSRKSC